MGRLQDTDILGEVFDPVNRSRRENVRLSELREYILGVIPISKEKPKPKVSKNEK